VAAMTLMAISGGSMAGNGPPPPSGIFEGQGEFPDKAFVYAHHGSAGQAQCGYPDKNLVKDMEVDFETRTSGVALVTFCGTLDVASSTSKVSMVANIDGFADRCYIDEGDTEWDVSGDGVSNDGPICVKWVCEVANEPCGKNSQGNTCWTEHDVSVSCGYDYAPGFAQFNDRNLTVEYNKQQPTEVVEREEY
jgi:hypothetical protein